MKKKTKTKKGRHAAKINTKRYFMVLGVTIALILVAVLGCMALNIGNFSDSNTEKVETAPITEGKINILLMGVDEGGLRTDAIMLASYNTETKQVHMLSIPRDTRMYIGTRYQKINAAHAITGGTGKIAGAQGTIEAVTRLTAVPINYYVEFSFNSIAACMDELGTITFDVPDIEGGGKGLVYDDPVQDLHINIPAGVQELDGKQVVHLLRYRKGNYNKATKSRPQYKNGDIGRIEMQQQFLKALVDQKLNASLILKLPAIFKTVSEGIKTNLTVKDVIKYSSYLNDFTSEGVHTYSLPGNTSGGEYDASYWICDLDATREIIQNDFGYDASGITIDKPGDTSGEKKDSSKNTTDKGDTSKATAKPTASSQKKQQSASSGSSTAKATEKPKTSTQKKSSTTESKSDGSSKTNDAKKDTQSSTQTPKKSNGTDSTKSDSKTSSESKSDSSEKTASKTAMPQKKSSGESSSAAAE